MKLESLKENKFKDSVLKKEQMFTLNGGGTATPGGRGCGVDQFGRTYFADYGYDAIRKDANGREFITFHNKTNVNWSGSEGPCVH